MISQMLLDKLCNYEIIRKQNKTTQEAFTYYIITEGEGESLKCLYMIMANGKSL